MLEFSEVSRRYGDVVALDGISFAVDQGQVMGFVGRNGAGKTTAMRIALGLLAADSGEVRWKGSRVTAAMRQRIGYMPEERGLYPKMRVGDHLRYLGRLSGLGPGEAAEAADTWMGRLGIAERAGDRVNQLSLGNQQRVQLAAALVHGPDLLVLDEPFSGLDPVGVDVMADVLRAEADRGVPVIFSSHQLELIERLCDTVTIIEAGRLVASGPIAELRASRTARRVRVEVTGAPPDWAGRVAGVRAVERSGSALLIDLTDDADEQVVLDVARSCGRVRHFSVVTQSLTDLFREVVQSEPAGPEPPGHGAGARGAEGRRS